MQLKFVFDFLHLVRGVREILVCVRLHSALLSLQVGTLDPQVCTCHHNCFNPDNHNCCNLTQIALEAELQVVLQVVLQMELEVVLQVELQIWRLSQQTQLTARLNDHKLKVDQNLFLV